MMMVLTYADRLLLALETLNMIYDRDEGIIADDDLLGVAAAFTTGERDDFDRLVHDLDLATMAPPE